MAIDKFIKHIPKDSSDGSYDLIVVQDRLEVVIDAFTRNPVNDSVLLEEIEIGTSTTLVPHKLSRASRGYFIVKQDANATIWQDTTVTNNLELFIPLVASAAVTVSLVVF